MPRLESKLSEEQKAEVCDRYSRLGETYAELAKDFNVAITTIRKYVKASSTKKLIKQRVTPATSMVEFKKRAKSILWRQDSGNSKDRKAYNSWMEKVNEFKRGGMNPQQAVVQASKDFQCLARLFREYDVGENDPHPDSHPAIQQYGQQAPMEGIECEGKNLSHHENLMWAIATAGKKLRTGDDPEIAPNDAAYFLYRQACDDPKEFLGKFTQVDMRSGDDLEDQRLAKKSGERSIEELNEMLQTLTEGECNE